MSHGSTKGLLSEVNCTKAYAARARRHIASVYVLCSVCSIEKSTGDAASREFDRKVSLFQVSVTLV